MKVTVAKSLAMGEQVVVELAGPVPVILKELPLAYRIVDERLVTMNLRVLALNERYQKLVKVNPEIAVLVNDIMSVVAGQKLTEDTSTVIPQVDAA